MVAWSEFEEAEPELAASVQKRFETARPAMLATLRADGAPRLSPVEVFFQRGQVWLPMMPSSLKGGDLARDGRMAVHSAVLGEEQGKGDAKLAAHAHPADESEREAFAAANPIPGGAFELFRLDVREVSTLCVRSEDLLIDVWSASAGRRSVARS